MKPIWLIERGVYGEQAAALIGEVQRQGMRGYEVDYRPGKPPPLDIVGSPFLPDGTCVVLWCTLPLFQQVQLHRRWIPGGWCSAQQLECEVYYPQFEKYLLNQPYRILPGAVAAQMQAKLFAKIGDNDEIFVRPSSVQKHFPGGVAYMDDFADMIAAARYNPEVRVVVASPRDLGREWRCVIAGDEVITTSQYREQGAISITPGCPAEVLQFVREMLQNVRWRPEPLFMLDVCESNEQLWLLELNSFSCSGFYACDLAAIVAAASEIAEQEFDSFSAQGL